MASSSLTLVLCYRDPHYGRFRALLESSYKIPGVKIELIQNTTPGLLRYWQTFWRLLARKQRQSAYLLGFRGLEFYFVLRAIVGKQPIILDVLMSPSLALLGEKQSWLALIQPLLFRIERHIYHSVEHILVDTESHRKLFHESFDLPLSQISVLPVGAEEGIFKPIRPTKRRKNSDFTVLYYFSGQKLHGVDLVDSVREKFSSSTIRWILIGPGLSHLENTPNTEIYPSVPYRLLPHFIAQTDLCLVGPFLHSSQAERVITTKAFQCLAQGKPIVIGENRETLQIFTNKIDALTVPLSQPQALYAAVSWAIQNPKLLRKIGERGAITYKRKFSSALRARKLQQVLENV